MGRGDTTNGRSGGGGGKKSYTNTNRGGGKRLAMLEREEGVTKSLEVVFTWDPLRFSYVVGRCKVPTPLKGSGARKDLPSQVGSSKCLGSMTFPFFCSTSLPIIDDQSLNIYNISVTGL